jgi:hypothetical protein
MRIGKLQPRSSTIEAVNLSAISSHTSLSQPAAKRLKKLLVFADGFDIPLHGFQAGRTK